MSFPFFPCPLSHLQSETLEEQGSASQPTNSWSSSKGFSSSRFQADRRDATTPLKNWNKDSNKDSSRYKSKAYPFSLSNSLL